MSVAIASPGFGHAAIEAICVGPPAGPGENRIPDSVGAEACTQGLRRPVGRRSAEQPAVLVHAGVSVA